MCCLHFDKGYQEAITSIYDSVIANCTFKRFVLNVSDFIRQFKVVDVQGFYEDYFKKNGFRLITKNAVKTKRQKGVGSRTRNACNGE